MKLFDINAKRPLIIAGPCSAETREQTVDTCTQLAASGLVDVLRAGIWKPRTKPGSFEGMGVQALEWLAEAKKITGLPIAIEVATGKHVESALKYGVDVIWIGARTTVNPFSVQDVADALRGNNDLTVLIKNPVNPDLDLWAGAVERFASVGFRHERMGLIHRGFSYLGENRYRNSPMWHLGFEMRSRFPDIAMICDPSHIGGDRSYIHEIAQTAADLRYDGLMIESHINPANALSDALQQLAPTDLETILRSLHWRSEKVENPKFVKQLEKYRREIDQIDSELFSLLSLRMDIADKIGKVKKDNNVAILQGARWRDVVEKVTSQAHKLNLSDDFIKTLLQSIHLESINRQNKIMNK